ncbi:hypothetical protein H8356DRAFT_1336232 [Neocallimastix lanati (nom. inval.)]|nr:hypothetical protein H8356DRAFT_1336232 [Neocallimastix sp. JGI-2020a]
MNNELVSSTDEKLKALNSHYKFLGLDSSGHSLSKDFWKDSDALMNLGTPRLAIKKFSKPIYSTSEFKALILSWNINNVVTDTNNIELSTDSDSNSENNSIVTNNVVNGTIEVDVSISMVKHKFKEEIRKSSALLGYKTKTNELRFSRGLSS